MNTFFFYFRSYTKIGNENLNSKIQFKLKTNSESQTKIEIENL